MYKLLIIFPINTSSYSSQFVPLLFSSPLFHLPFIKWVLVGFHPKSCNYVFLGYDNPLASSPADINARIICGVIRRAARTWTASLWFIWIIKMCHHHRRVHHHGIHHLSIFLTVLLSLLQQFAKEAHYSDGGMWRSNWRMCFWGFRNELWRLSEYRMGDAAYLWWISDHRIWRSCYVSNCHSSKILSEILSEIQWNYLADKHTRVTFWLVGNPIENL